MGVLLAVAAVMAPAAVAAPGTARASRHRASRHVSSSRFQIRHVFVIVLENESASTTFGPATPAPYLARTMTSRGAFLPNYWGTGHNSNDNYISMISGQAPNASTQADCPVFSDFPPGPLGAHGQEPGHGCVYPADVPTIASQLDAAHLSWRDYNQSMGADPARESAVCGHPPIGGVDNTEAATTTDTYATRHDPFVYFHSIIDYAKLCDGHVVGLDRLRGDLRQVSSTRNYTFITPDLCSDGHDTPCPAGGPGGLAQV
ncbi:MAG: alkaline phosphatase family protein, partial [Solirubrobacteraceae bacterium]